MEAYTALLTLSQILDKLQPRDRRQFFHAKDDLVESLRQKVGFLQDFLENSPSDKASNFAATESLETRISAAAYAAEDIIESHISNQLLANRNTFWHLDSFWKMIFRVQSAVSVAVHVFWTPIAHLNAVSVVAQILISARRNHKWVQVIKEMDFIMKEVDKIKNACCAGEDLWKNRTILPASTKASSRLHLGMRGENLVVGFEGDLSEVRSRMVGASCNLETVSIVGMGGIGKTTLARQVYDDNYMVYRFDIRAWVAVSQEYSLRRVLLGLLDSAKLLNADMQDKEDEELAVYLYKSLKGRRYLIVMDDMWDTEIWDAVRRLFPDDGTGSRVLLTTRISVVLNMPTLAALIICVFSVKRIVGICFAERFLGKEPAPWNWKKSEKRLHENVEGFPYQLSVLDVVVIHFHEFPAEVIELVNLRYLAFTCAWQLPPSILKLQNLETLVYHKWKSQQYPLLPRDIRVMPKLRHLWVTPSCFLDHAQLLPNNSFLLENLRTLSEVRNLKCSSDIIKRIPNLRKLKISYDVFLFESWSSYQLENLISLHKLETLTLRTENSCHIPDVVYPEKLGFPLQLRKLTLSGLRLPWRNLNIIGALPNLEVLKLRRNACQGPEWRPIEGDFCQLKFLLLEGLDIVQWRAENTHSPVFKT
ncbi:UNVERIFIED_CONTAM: putative disease resistance RPP13-like protein 3 [Sesamum calycinum]|uniref:Disease resistance RPP13-like protein 3 n=1 Tax=Sesamum calycinum TaxID=2727403 RepID=A0AAW2PNW9_9LAMI